MTVELEKVEPSVRIDLRRVFVRYSIQVFFDPFRRLHMIFIV
jgi:hypothetical protein